MIGGRSANISITRQPRSASLIDRKAKPLRACPWSYKSDHSNAPSKADEIDLLTDAGEQGWELVTIVANGIAC
jgi:hypothetical protein